MMPENGHPSARIYPFEPSNQVTPTFQVEGKALQTENSLYLFLRVEVPEGDLKAPFAPRDSGRKAGPNHRPTRPLPGRQSRVCFYRNASWCPH